MLRTLLRQSSSLFTATLITNACSYLLNLYVARKLGPAEYGTLGALIALFYIAVIPAGAIQTGVVRFASTSHATQDRVHLAALLYRLNIVFLGGLGVAMVLLLLGADRIATLLQVGSVYPVLALALLLGLNFLLAITRGALQGWQRFTSLSFNISLEAVARLVFALALVFLGYGLSGVLTGYCLASLTSFLLSWHGLPVPRQGSSGPSLREILGYSGPVLIAYIAFAWMTNVDILFAKHFLHSETAGHYVALSTLAKLVFFIPGPLAEVMFSLTAGQSDHAAAGRLLYQTIGVDAAICAVAIGAYALFAQPIMTIIFGSAYAAASPELWRFGFANFLFTIVIIYSRSYLARNMTASVAILVAGSALQTILLVLVHGSIQQILTVLIASYTVTVVLLASVEPASRWLTWRARRAD